MSEEGDEEDNQDRLKTGGTVVLGDGSTAAGTLVAMAGAATGEAVSACAT